MLDSHTYTECDQILQELSAYSCHVRAGIHMHEEEPRTHCTREEYKNGSKDFILITNGSEGAIVHHVQVWVSLYGYVSPDQH